VDGTYDKLDHRVIQFWMQAKQLGSKLFVGIVSPATESTCRNDMILNACAVSAVDVVIAEAPQHLDLKFLNKFQIDYVAVCLAMGKRQSVGLLSDEIFENKKVIAIDENGMAFPVLSRVSLKAD
jgi:glycerol-3-phosphate cytidylyltransferase-like family protein